jgi:hypothetical protein
VRTTRQLGGSSEGGQQATRLRLTDVHCCRDLWPLLTCVLSCLLSSCVLSCQVIDLVANVPPDVQRLEFVCCGVSSALDQADCYSSLAGEGVAASKRAAASTEHAPPCQ